jgi:hypothetical protein
VKIEFEKNLTSLKSDLDNYDNIQMALKLSQIVAGLRDGHTEIQIHQPNIGLHRLPLQLYFFQEGLYLIGSHSEYKQHLGSKVKSIGGMPVAKVIELLTGLMTHDNEFEIYHAGPGFIILPSAMKYLGVADDSESVKFVLSSKEGDQEVTIQAKSINDYVKGPWLGYLSENKVEKPLYLTDSDRNHWFRFLEKEKTVYFYYGTVSDQKGYPNIKKVVKELFELIDKVRPEKLVIDLRKNRGGNYNKSRPLVDEITKRLWLNQLGKIYSISGRATFSAALVTCIFLKKETNTLLIGEPSRGHPNKTDNVEHLLLPNSKLRLEYTTRILKHWPELGDVNVLPVDVALPIRFEDYATGVDSVLGYIFKK